MIEIYMNMRLFFDWIYIFLVLQGGRNEKDIYNYFSYDFDFTYCLR